MTDYRAAHRIIDSAISAGIAPRQIDLDRLGRIQQLLDTAVGEEALSQHKARVVAAVAGRIMANESPRFVEEWSSGASSCVTPAWVASRSAVAVAGAQIYGDVRAHSTIGLREQWPLAVGRAIAAYLSLGRDCSVESALKSPQIAQAGVAAVDEIRALTELTDVLLRVAPSGAHSLGADRAFGALTFDDRPIDWTASPLDVLQQIGDWVADWPEIPDPIEARLAGYATLAALELAGA